MSFKFSIVSVDIVPGAGIPGLDWDKEVEVVKHTEHNIHQRKKVPYSRPVPRQFEQAWAENKQPGILVPDSDGNLKVMPKQGQPKHNPPALMEMPVQNQPGQRPRGPGQEQQRMPGPGQGPRGQFMHPGPDGMNQGPRFNNQGNIKLDALCLSIYVYFSKINMHKSVSCVYDIEYVHIQCPPQVHHLLIFPAII